MNKVFLWSDLHISHSRAYSFDSQDGERKMRPFKDMYECEKTMVDNYNSIVGDNDKVYFLGDIFLNKDRAGILKFMKKGSKHLVMGNHDNKGDITFYREFFDKIYGVLYLPKIKCILSHMPVHSYFLGPQDYLQGQTRFDYNIHGHCVSIDTEILTIQGWKSYKDLIIGEEVYSLNSNLELEKDIVVDKIIKTSNENYVINSKGLNMNLTKDHNMLLGNYRKDKLELRSVEKALESNILYIPRTGIYKNTGINLSNELIKLYIYLAADGNIKNETKLCRLVVKKDYKIKAFKDCLNNLNITYKQYPQKDGSLSLNFYMPEELYDYNIKGLDKKLKNCNQEQAEVIFQSYIITDGNRNLIFTSKKEEVDILQHMFTLNGYLTKLGIRVCHGFSKKESYQLSVSRKTFTQTKNNLFSFDNSSNLYWCPTIKNNHNFIARYKGSIFITGNCHDHHVLTAEGTKDYRYLNSCVEITNYKPVEFEELISINKSIIINKK